VNFDLFADDPIVEAQAVTVPIFDEPPADMGIPISPATDELERARQHLATVRAKYAGVWWPTAEQVAEIQAAEQAVEVSRGATTAEPLPGLHPHWCACSTCRPAAAAPPVCDPVQVVEPSKPAPARKPKAKAPDPERIAYMLEPAGLNRWTYRGELVTYDDRKHTVAGRGRWCSVEGIGKAEIRGDTHVEVCKVIDARLGEEVSHG
jgi:hypothetical protein